MALGNIHLTPQLVQAVRDAADIVDVASEHTRLKQQGRKYLGLCPLHKEKSPSFNVDPAQGFFYCFGCSTGGDAIKLHMLVTGDEFPEAIEALALRYGIPLPSRSQARDSRGREGPDIRKALETAERFFRHHLEKAPEARRYLEERRIDSELIERYHLGYAPPGWRDLTDALTRKLPLGDLVAAGLVGRRERDDKPYDRFRHRLMFPIHTAAGRLVGFGGRTLGDDRAKYVNTSETDQFHKGNLLYGLYQARRRTREEGVAVLTEGYFDVLGVVAAGEGAAVAGMGTALTLEQARLLARYADEVIVAFDGDDAGEAAYRRALPLLLGAGLGVRRARFPAGHDPDSLRLAEGPEAVLRALSEARDGVETELERLIPDGGADEPREQGRIATQVASLLAPIKDPIVRHGYVRVAADRLRVPEELMIQRLQDGLRQARGARPGRGGPPGDPRLGGPPPDLPPDDRPPGDLPPNGPPGSGPGPGRSAGSGRGGGQPRLTHTEETRVLALLLSGEVKVPSRDTFPPPEVFQDPEGRNIFRAFCDLYMKEGQPPDAAAVSGVLAAEGASFDRLAQLLIDRPSAFSEANLPTLFARLSQHWQRRRMRELAHEIAQAERRGDRERLDELVEEKRTVSLQLHRRR